jgi:predicted O-methyltransferase YrrM
MKETDAIDEYILQHIDEESDYLKALYRDTHVKLLRPRMASGHLQGRMLKMFVHMIRPRQVLEIGTYSGYSALCLAEGLEEGATLHKERRARYSPIVWKRYCLLRALTVFPTCLFTSPAEASTLSVLAASISASPT